MEGITATIPFTKLGIDIPGLFRRLGYPDCSPPESIATAACNMVREAGTFCSPSYCFAIYDCNRVGPGVIEVGDERFDTGTIIVRQMEGAEKAAVFVATAGGRFDAWLQSMKGRNDIWIEFLADAIGSEIAEAASRALVEAVCRYSESVGMKSGNGYSPGYCGWSVADQKKLFALLQPNPCGVSLNGSWLMTPIKSVSGIVGIGENVRKKEYECLICDKADCHRPHR